MSDLTPVQAVDNCIALLQTYRTSITPTGTIIRVKNGDDIQKAHDAAKPGDTLLVQPGPYLGVNLFKNIIMLPDATIPSGRIDKAQTGLIELTARDSSSQPLTIPGNGVNVMGVRTKPCALSAMTTLTGDGIVLDRVLGLGDPTIGQRRGIAANGSNIHVIKSTFDDIFNSEDAQTIEWWNGAGPLEIDDCYLSSSGECVLSGGADSIKQPSNLLLTNSYLTKKVGWMSPTAKVKNSLELKDMIGAVIKNNTFENSWKDGQTGYLILFTPRNQGGTEPFAGVMHILFQNNIVRNGGAGFQLLGSDNEHPSQQMVDVQILDNQIDNIGAYPGDHRFVTMTGTPGCKDVVIARNKCTNFHTMNSFLYLDSPQDNLVFTDNEVFEGEYGVKANGVAAGIASWNAMVTGGQFANNKIHAGGIRTVDYGGNGNVVVP